MSSSEDEYSPTRIAPKAKAEKKVEEKKKVVLYCSDCEIEGHTTAKCPLKGVSLSLGEKKPAKGKRKRVDSSSSSCSDNKEKECEHCGKKGHSLETCLKKYKEAVGHEASVLADS